ncbi:probable G-protein coupled receptor 25 [Anabas testudineus]|uniref:G-protein coupled receptors family 1 profile domain-containing protein n=1 Tax=Anabas testudineus TaxID=64144 RepID=A0A3Q1KH84_ANATE|nr:probable G-protein coupled receptor 25 [Anabas testudineus]
MDDYTDYAVNDYNYSDSDNDTSLEFAVDCIIPQLHGSNIFLPTVYYLIFFMGFLGNLFVVLVVCSKSRRSRRLVDTFIVNLALADLVFVLTLPLWATSASQHGKWEFGPAGNLLCKLSSYVIAVNRFSNIFFLTCMSVDRYLAVVKLMDSRYLRSSLCIQACCAAVWLCSLVMGIPVLLYRRVEEFDDKLFCMEEDNSPFFLGLSLTMVLLTFVFPVLIIVLCYGTIIGHLNKHCVATVNPRADARRRHSLKMVLSIIVAFVVSWLPFNIFKVIIIGSQLLNARLTCETQSWQINGLLISGCLAFLNSCVNPAIYFFLDHQFRRRAETLCKTFMGNPKLLQSYNSSASFTNNGTSESFAATGGRTQFQLE